MNNLKTIMTKLAAGPSGGTLVNLITGAPLMQPKAVPAGVMLAPARRHLVDVLAVLPAGPGIQQVPSLRDLNALAAGVQSSEGTTAGSNAAAELEPCRQSFALIMATVPASREILADSSLVAALLDGELREALRSKADAELARQLATYALTFTPSSSAGLIERLVAGVLAFGKRWGGARAILLDHSKADAGELIAAAPGVVAWQPDGTLTLAGVPVVLADLDTAGEAIITAGTVLEREAEAVLGLEEITSGVITLKATARLAAVGPALRVVL